MPTFDATNCPNGVPDPDIENGTVSGAVRPPEYEDIAQRILQLLYRLLEPFKLDEEQAVHAVRGLRSLLHGFASLEAAEGFRMSVDKDASLRFIIVRYMEGIQSLPNR